MNASLSKAGIRGSGSLMANSFRNWGLPVAPGDVHKGDVMVVLGGRHVGMATGRVSGHLIEMLSGNTGGKRGDRTVGTGWYDDRSAVIRRALQGRTHRDQESANHLFDWHSHKFAAADLTMPHRGGGTQQAGHVYLDGRKVGKVMWGELHRAVQGPSVGSLTPDGSRGHYGSGSSYNVSFA